MFQFEEEEELALIFLQKVLRGRAIQNMVSFFREPSLINYWMRAINILLLLSDYY